MPANANSTGSQDVPQGENPITPWNPSRRAIKRVKNPLPVPTVCNCCSGPVRICENKEIYGGRNYGEWPWAYHCEECNAHVGMHPYTNIPLGTLADLATRDARKTCKPYFEALFLSGKMTRSEAYRQLAKALGIPEEECHFGWFDVAMCEKAKKAALELAKATQELT